MLGSVAFSLMRSPTTHPPTRLPAAHPRPTHGQRRAHEARREGGNVGEQVSLGYA